MGSPASIRRARAGVTVMTAPLVVVHVASDAILACVLFIMAVLLLSLVTAAKGTFRCAAFAWVIAFLLLRILSHVLAVALIWVPLDGVNGAVKAITAGVAIVMVVVFARWIKTVQIVIEEGQIHEDTVTVRGILDRLQEASSRHIPRGHDDGDP